jgi:selenocysteine lyase/cysteine desulfurase
MHAHPLTDLDRPSGIVHSRGRRCVGTFWSVQNPAYDISALRSTIPLLRACIPMNNCSQAPQTFATRAAAELYLESWNASGMDWDAWMAEVQRAKAAFARLINAPSDAVAVVSSVSEATSAIASALSFTSKRKRVVLSEAEFPGVAHVWRAQERRGAELHWVPLRDGRMDEAAYDGAIDDRTVIVSACHAYYVNGFIQDVASIARRARAHDALVFVDAYQTLGAIPIDVTEMGVDLLASGALKFLMGVPGIAFLYVRPAIMERLEPLLTGWFGRANPFAFDSSFGSGRLDWSPTASRFETGTPPVVNAYIARAGMELVEQIGVPQIREWHIALSRRLVDGGRARSFPLHGTDSIGAKTVTTAFALPNANRIEEAMRARGVLPSARGPVLRFAPHFYSSLEDVDTALDTLAEVVRA